MTEQALTPEQERQVAAEVARLTGGLNLRPKTLEEEVAELVAAGAPMVEPVEPGDAPAPQIPYEKANRVPEALLDLEAKTAAALLLDVQQLVIIEGATAPAGRQAAWFEIRRERAVERIRGYVVAFLDSSGRLHLKSVSTRAAGSERWADIANSFEVMRRAAVAVEILDA